MRCLMFAQTFFSRTRMLAQFSLKPAQGSHSLLNVAETIENLSADQRNRKWETVGSNSCSAAHFPGCPTHGQRHNVGIVPLKSAYERIYPRSEQQTAT